MKTYNLYFVLALVSVFFNGCASSIPQRDLMPEKAKSRGYFLSYDEVKERGGMGQFAPMICTNGGWGFPVDCSSRVSATTAAPVEVKKAQTEIATTKEEMLTAKYDAKKTVRFYFDTAKSALTADDQEKLNQLKASKVFIIRGYADSRGSAKLNQKLSLNRAEQVLSHLKKRGFDTKDANVAGLGAVQGADSGSAATEARRVEVIFE